MSTFEIISLVTSNEVVSLVASTASIVLAILAIWLSIVFFRLSSELSENAKEATKGIGTSVDKVEKLFDKLYADTFSMMRDTVSDMRKHIWPNEANDPENLSEEAAKKADEKVELFKSDIVGEISTLLHRQQITDEKIGSLSIEMGGLVDRVVEKSRQAVKFPPFFGQLVKMVSDG